MIDGTTHPNVSFALDIADKAIKAVAVIIGGLWVFWNHAKSRTYEQKLELEITGTVFVQQDLYGDVKAVVKNIGATKHALQQAGTYCELFTIGTDLVERSVRIFPIFTLQDRIEPQESVDETLCWRIPRPLDNIVWVKLNLQVVSDGVEWSTTCMIRVETSDSAGSSDTR